MTRLIVALVMFIGAATSAQAQDACDPTPGPRDVPVLSGLPSLAFISPMHTAKNVAGQDVLDDYFVEVFVAGGAKVTDFTLPKTDFTLQVVPTAHCYQSAAMPAVSGLLPTNFYTVKVTARGPGGTGATSVSSDRFFLEGAPVVSGLRLVAPSQ